MMARLEVIRQVRGESSLVARYQDAPLPLGPDQKGGIIAAQRQIGRVADTDNVEHLDAPSVMPLDGPPQNATKMLIEQITQWHGSQLPWPSLRWGLGLSRQPLPDPE